jgi:hypothetical protein
VSSFDLFWFFKLLWIFIEILLCFLIGCRKAFGDFAVNPLLNQLLANIFFNFIEGQVFFLQRFSKLLLRRLTIEMRMARI